MTEFLYGRRPVLEAFRAGRRDLIQLILAENLDQRGIVADIIAEARRCNVRLRQLPRRMLDDMTGRANHQGVVLKASDFAYSGLDDAFALAEERGELPFFLVLDLLQDPQNVGTLLRVAEGVGVHGVIIQERRAVDILPSVVSASSGAVEYLHVIRVANLVYAMRELKERDVWITGFDASPRAIPLGNADLKGAVALVLGSEGEGMRRLVRETCDFLVQIPMRGHIESLNVSTAGAVALYTAWGQRGWAGWQPDSATLADEG